MPIVVAHEPDPRGIAGVAYNAGLGQYRLKQQEMGLQWTQLALQNQAQQNQAALGYQRNMLDYQQQQDANARWASDRQQQAMMDMAQMGQRQQQFDAGLAEQQRWRDAQMEQHQGDLAFRRESQQAGFDNQQALMEQEFAGRGEYARQQREAEYDDFRRRQDDELTISGKRFRTGIQNQLDSIDEQITNGDMHWEDGEIAKKEIHARAAGVDVSSFLNSIDLARQKQKLRERIESSMVEMDGRMMTVGKNGEPAEVFWRRDPQEELRAKSRQQAINLYQDLLKLNQSQVKPSSMPSLKDWLKEHGGVFNMTPQDIQQMFPGDVGAAQQPQLQTVSPEVDQVAMTMDPTTATRFKMMHMEDFSKAPPTVVAAAEFLKELMQKHPTPEKQQLVTPAEAARAERASAIVNAYRQQRGANRSGNAGIQPHPGPGHEPPGLAVGF